MISFRGMVECFKHSRWYSSDMTVFSCLACYLFAMQNGGNFVNGIVAFIGILFAHMATNLYDDYDDFKVLSKDARFDEFAPDVKCAYLRSGVANTQDLLAILIVFCNFALLAGAFLFFRCGFWVLILALIGGLIVLSYPKFSRAGLSEILVGIAFGPLLFEGMYFVMTNSFSIEVLILSIAIASFTVGVMYLHTVLDFDGDKAAGKNTIVQKIGDKKLIMRGLVSIYAIGFVFLLIFSIITKNYFSMLGFLAIPIVVMLYNALKMYNSEVHYARNKAYLAVLTGAAKTMAIFAFLISTGLFIKLCF